MVINSEHDPVMMDIKSRSLRERGRRMNRIAVEVTDIRKNQILCAVTVEGTAREAFRKDRFVFAYESNCELSSVPGSIAVIPALSCLLPIAWVYDARIETAECDRDFYESIPEFKQGYIDMYPMLSFGGSLHAERIVENRRQAERALSFFSGGVDSVDTAIAHLAEKPLLLTVWGADIPLSEPAAWRELVAQTESAAKTLEMEYATVSANLRTVIREDILDGKVAESGEGWWHGFQHGIGLICLAAPIAWQEGVRTIYFAASFTRQDIGKYCCASDPGIDSHVRFCGTEVVHDGFERDRMEKLRRIAAWRRKTGKKLPLRVCWINRNSKNCCHCEKCERTILGLYAVGEDPRDYGFAYDSLQEIFDEMHRNAERMLENFDTRYLPILRAMHEQYTEDTIREDLRWLWEIDIGNAGELFRWMRRKDARARAERKEWKQRAERQRKELRKLQKKNRELQQSREALKRSGSYRLGRALTWPVRTLKSWTFWQGLALRYWALYGRLHRGWRQDYAGFLCRWNKDKKRWKHYREQFTLTAKTCFPELLRGGKLPAARLFDYWLCYAFLGATANENYYHYLFLRHGWRYRRRSVTNRKTFFASDYLNSAEAAALTRSKAQTAAYWEDWFRRGWCLVSQERPVTVEELRRVRGSAERLIVKPDDDYGGHGIFALDARNEPELEAAAVRLNSLETAHIVEPWVEQTGLLHALNPSSVNTVRAVTGKHSDGSIEVMLAYLRLGHAGELVDNVSVGGILFYVDHRTGRVEGGMDYQGKTYRTHPDTGETVTGLQIPRWQEFLDFCVSAHRHAPEGLVLAGWDVCISETEMYLIETNVAAGMSQPLPWLSDPWRGVTQLLEEKERGRIRDAKA